MQHKRKTPLKAIIAALTLLTLIIGAVFLASTPIPSPKQPIEKQLDSGVLLEAKPN